MHSYDSGLRPPARARARLSADSSALAVIMYALRPDVVAECERVTTELRVARVEVKHLQAACSAIAAHPISMIVASAGAIRPWDREVLDDHAARAGVTVRWVTEEDDGDRVADEVRGWASGLARRARTGR